MATVLNTNFAHITLADRIRGAYASFKQAAELRAKFRTTVFELNSLSTRELDDLGISRYDIADLAHEHVYGK